MNGEEKIDNRIGWLDETRCIAILSVIFCHSVECSFYIYRDHLEYWNTLDLFSKLFDSFGMAIGRLGVPLFFFITGALVLSKKLDSDEGLKSFYRKNFLSLFITMEIWIVIWNLFLIGFGNIGGDVQEVTLRTFLQNIFLLTQVDTIMPAWYVPVILFIYAMLPVLIISVKHIPFKVACIPLIFLVFFYSVIPLVNELLCSISIQMIPVGMVFHDMIYFVYIILGYYIFKESILSRFNKWIIIIGFIISLSMCVLMSFWLNENDVSYKLGYNNTFLIISTACLFELLRRTGNYCSSKNYGRGALFISEISLGLFFVHNPIQYLIWFKFDNYLSSISLEMETIVIFIVSTSCSILTVYLISRIMVLRRILFRMK